MPGLTRRTALQGLGTGGAALALGALAPAASADHALSDPALDVSHATPEVVRLVTATFRDKTARDPDRTMAHFSQRSLTYVDATIGIRVDWAGLHAAFAQLMPTWPDTARSYPTRILGDARSALVFFTDSPELFGHEIRAVAPIDFRNGLIVREVDYWDGRHFGIAATEALRTPPAQFPTDFGESAVGEQANPVIRRVASALANAFATGNAAAATELFTDDAAFEDLTLHSRIVGPLAIRTYLDRSLARLPYGPGTAVRHVVGSAQGGGYEWTAPHGPVDHGVVALELDQHARISRLTTVWDGSLVDNGTITDLLARTIEQ
jgi:hypothetical protein